MAPVQNYIHTSCISFTPRAQPTASHWKNVHLMFMLQNFASDDLYLFFFKKMGQPRPLFRLFSVFFKQTLLQFLQQINVKKCHVHPDYMAPGFEPTTFGS